MASIHVAIIHGIGKNAPGFSTDLIKGIAAEFNRFLGGILKKPSNYAKDLNFIEIVWDDILAENEKKLEIILKRALEQRRRRVSLIRLVTIAAAAFLLCSLVFKNPGIAAIVLLLGGYKAYKLYFQLRTSFASEFVVDILGYGNEQTKNMIQERIDGVLGGITTGNEKEMFTLVSHSLGTVITSDYVWDRQKPVLHPKLTLCNFFTMGSPLALFALRFGREMFDRPIMMEHPDGRWINLLDTDDPIAYPLKDLNPAYDYMVSKDQEVETGIIGAAHIGYWTCPAVHRTIGRKLALDWLRANNKITEDEFQKRLSAELKI